MSISKKIYYLVLFLLLLNSVSCSKTIDDSTCFYGEVQLVDKSTLEIEPVQSEIIELNDIYAGQMYVRDSLAFFVSHLYPNHNIYTYNLNTGDLVGKYIEKGIGDNEIINMSTTLQPLLSNQDLCYWMYPINNRKMMCWNVSKSIENKKTVYDSIMPIKRNGAPYNYVYMLDDYEYLTKGVDPDAFDAKYIYPKFQLKNCLVPTDDSLRTFLVYKTGIDNETNEYNPDTYYSSIDRLNADNSRVVMVMSFLAQINILDLDSGVVKAVRLKDTPGFGYFYDDFKTLKLFYASATVTDNNIYALYSNTRIIEHGGRSEETSFDEVHVFDWDGNLVRLLKLDNKVNQISIDPANNILYGTDLDENVFRFAL